MNITLLPDEMILEIIKWLSFKDQKNVALIDARISLIVRGHFYQSYYYDATKINNEFQNKKRIRKLLNCSNLEGLINYCFLTGLRFGAHFNQP